VFGGGFECVRGGGLGGGACTKNEGGVRRQKKGLKAIKTGMRAEGTGGGGKCIKTGKKKKTNGSLPKKSCPEDHEAD